MKHYLMEICNEVVDVFKQTKEDELKNFINNIHKNNRIFIDGEGRSGFVGKCFAMRLMHLGYEVYVMGETNTPSFQKKDIYIAISGSGNTATVKLNADKAKKVGAKILVVTSDRVSSLGKLSDQIIELHATVRDNNNNRKSIQLLGSLFDQSAHLLLDSLCLTLSIRDEISNEEATRRHV